MLRPTFLKTSLSLIILLVSGPFLLSSCTVARCKLSTGSCASAYCSEPAATISIALLSAFIFYIIYSFFQKKK